MNQNRVPKGTPKTGGQFAEGRKPSGGDLATATCPKCGGEVRELPAYNPTDQSDPFPNRTVSVCGKCGYQPSDVAGSASDLELADRLNDAHIAWQEFDDGEQLNRGDFDSIYGTLDDSVARLRGDANDPASTNASDIELANQLDDAKHMIRNFDEDDIPLSREDVDYIYGSLETARERLGDGGPHGEPEDAGYYCPTCDIYADSAEEVCSGCGNDMWPASGTRANEITNIIFSEFATPDERPIDVMPNDLGCELLARSSIEVTEEHSGDDGTYWRGALKVGEMSLGVRSDGADRPNSYWVISAPLISDKDAITTINDLVLRGFPGLDLDMSLKDTDALDVFCTLAQIVQENTP